MPKDVFEPVDLSVGFVGATEGNAKPDAGIDKDHLKRLADRPFPSIDPDGKKFTHLGM